jgi:hypothetical protein
MNIAEVCGRVGGYDVSPTISWQNPLSLYVYGFVNGAPLCLVYWFRLERWLCESRPIALTLLKWRAPRACHRMGLADILLC